MDREVAIKQLPRSFSADEVVRHRFLTEARLLATLDHPHIVPVFDFVERDGLCLLVMEFLSGGTVWSRFAEVGLTPEEACSIALGTAAGLGFAHAHGILHRDINPESLVLDASGMVKVADFGLAKIVSGNATMVTATGQLLGTAAYMSPEQILGNTLTPATDLYALAMVLFELLAGTLPFDGHGDDFAILDRHLHDDPQALEVVAPQVPAGLAAVVARCLARSPQDRFQSAEEFSVALADATTSAWGANWHVRLGLPILPSEAVSSRLVNPSAPSPAEGGDWSWPSRTDRHLWSLPADPSELVPIARVAHDLAATSVHDPPRSPPSPPWSPAFPTAWSSASPSSSPSPSPPSSPPSSSRYRGVIVLALVAVAAIIGVAGVILTMQSAATHRPKGPPVEPTAGGTLFAGAAGPPRLPIAVGRRPTAEAISPNGATVYVSNFADDTITPIAATTGMAGNPIRVGRGPAALAVTPDSKTIYVTNFTDNTVTPVTSAGVAGIPIAVGKGPAGIAVTPDGATAYVANASDNTVTPIALGKATAGRPIPVGAHPLAVAISPDFSTAYAVNANDNTVTPIELATQTAGTPIAVGRYPDTIAISPDGLTAYVGNFNDATVMPILLRTNTVGAPIPVGRHPAAIAISPDGVTAYVTNALDNTVTQINLRTGKGSKPIALGHGPNAIVVTAAGRFAYVANYYDNTVSALYLPLSG
ncbi:MAG TPA: serine/threonine-protein kinase [Acidimicrobiales bacterium]|nr:serine/threonine-protein kinase [Acidimicrobiales bacterium]